MLDGEPRHPEPMSDADDFLAWVNSTLVDAERAQFDGNDRPRRAIWSKVEPVSVLGAWRSGVGRSDVVGAFEVVASNFSGCTDYSLDLVSYDVNGDMAYTVAYERITATVDGKPRTFTIRATQVYRREDGVWRVVHRHADSIA